MQVGIFLLRGAGWTAIGVFVGFIVSYFFRLPAGRVDTFALTETLLGVVITGLSIVGALTIALQWSNLESKIHTFDIKEKETTEFFDKQAERMRKIAQDIDEYVKSTIDGYKENVDYLDKLLKDNAKIANEINLKIDEYKKIYIENEKSFDKRQEEFEDRQREFSKIIEEYRKLTDKAVELRKEDHET